MSQVEFEDSEFNQNSPTFLYGRFVPSSKPPTLIKFVIRSGIAKSEREARHILVGICIVCLVSAAMIGLRVWRGYIFISPSVYLKKLPVLPDPKSFNPGSSH